MHLCAWNNFEGTQLIEIRELTTEEIAAHTSFVPAFKEAQNRMCLFKLLNKNYKEWDNFVKGLISTKARNFDDDYLELHRLLLNYLTTAYTIGQHFKVSYTKRNRAKSNQDDLYDKFVDGLCAASQDYAFISDYRGYVQHVGLGVQNYNRSVSNTGVQLTIAVEPRSILASSRSWAKSKLTKESPSIDLVGTIIRYHKILLEEYAPFVAKTFFPELVDADRFYKSLLKEVKERDPKARMIFCPERPEITVQGSLRSASIKWIGVPNDLFAEIGVRVEIAAASLRSVPAH